MRRTREGARRLLLESSHVTLRWLRELLPDALVEGGSFRPRLPAPAGLRLAEAQRLIRRERDAAVDRCLARLLDRAGSAYRGSGPVRRTRAGNREWPAGLCGSVTHKGTVVLCVAAIQPTYQSLGIDLERVDDADLSPIGDDLLDVERRHKGAALQSLTRAFCAKEAVFKADFPLHRERLKFDDVVFVEWSESRREFSGTAAVRGRRTYRFQGRSSATWALSVAIKH